MTFAGLGVALASWAARIPQVKSQLGLTASELGLLLLSLAELGQTEQPAVGAPSVWRERRTLLVGLMVLAFALAEGTGNGWISVSMVEGHATPAIVGTLTYSVFLAAMTLGRWHGPSLLDRRGRTRTLRLLAAVAAAGLLLFTLTPWTAGAFVGVALWGLGASLGFPVGMSAGADEPALAAPRVGAITSIGSGWRRAAPRRAPRRAGPSGDGQASAGSRLAKDAVYAATQTPGIAVSQRGRHECRGRVLQDNRSQKATKCGHADGRGRLRRGRGVRTTVFHRPADRDPGRVSVKHQAPTEARHPRDELTQRGVLIRLGVQRDAQLSAKTLERRRHGIELAVEQHDQRRTKMLFTQRRCAEGAQRR